MVTESDTFSLQSCESLTFSENSISKAQLANFIQVNISLGRLFLLFLSASWRIFPFFSGNRTSFGKNTKYQRANENNKYHHGHRGSYYGNYCLMFHGITYSSVTLVTITTKALIRAFSVYTVSFLWHRLCSWWHSSTSVQLRNPLPW